MARLGPSPRALKIAYVAVLLAAVSGAISAQQQTGGAEIEKTVLRGTVVNAVTRQPIGRALVKSTDGRFATMTDERGRFEMVFKERKNAAPMSAAPGPPSVGTALFPYSTTIHTNGTPPPGTVDRPDFLTAVRVGFLALQSSWGNGVPVARDQEEVTISLTPEAKVVGHVTLADGEGAAGIPVELYRQVMQDGRERWMGAGSAQARSDGEFRFADLEAGTYKLYSGELQDRDPVTSDPRAPEGWGYPPDYYPGATDFAGGAVIHLVAGETFQAALTPERRRYYRVHIGVAGGSGGQFEVEVERDGHPGPGFTLGYDDFRDGSIGGMLPEGNYLVKVSSQNPNGLTGVMNLSVHGGPAAGMVTLLPGTDVEVRVDQQFGDSGQAQQAQEQNSGGEEHPDVRKGRQVFPPIQLQLVPAEEFKAERQYMAQPPSDPASEGLVVQGVPAGEYRVNVQSPTGYVAAIRCGETDLQNSPLVVGGGTSLPPIEVTLRNDGAEIDGSIVDLANHNNSGNGPPPGFVYIVPARGGGEMKLAIAQPNGDFQIQQLAPGTYQVVAFDRPQNDLGYRDEDAMRKYDAQLVTVMPGQKEKIRVSFSAE